MHGANTFHSIIKDNEVRVQGASLTVNSFKDFLICETNKIPMKTHENNVLGLKLEQFCRSLKYGNLI